MPKTPELKEQVMKWLNYKSIDQPHIKRWEVIVMFIIELSAILILIN